MPAVRLAGSRRSRPVMALYAGALLVAAPLVLAQKPPATTTDTRETGRLRLGYVTDARPFSYKNDAGQAAGYSVALCQKVAESVRNERQLKDMPVEWIPVSLDERFNAVQQGQIDLLCGGDTVTLARRMNVSFSIPIFPGGIGALLRADAPVRLRDVLAGRGQTFRPTWRASAAQVLQARAFTAVAGTTSQKWLGERVNELNVVADVASASSYEAGIQGLLDRRSDVLFGERAILLDASRRHRQARDLMVIDRLYTYEPLAFALRRDDERFRLLVDRALSRFYRSGQFGSFYAQAFGEPGADALTFFRWNALPE